MLVGSPTIYSVRMWRRLEFGSDNDCLQAGKVFQRRLSGFGVILTIKQSLPQFTILCTTYTRVEELSSQALHKPQTYFYPYGQAVPDIGSPDEIKAELKSLGCQVSGHSPA